MQGNERPMSPRYLRMSSKERRCTPSHDDMSVHHHPHSIARNRQRLIALGVLDAVAELKAVAPKPPPKHTPPAKAPAEPTRRSKRLRGEHVAPPKEPPKKETTHTSPKQPRTPPAHTLEEKLAQLEVGGLVEATDKHAKYAVERRASPHVLPAGLWWLARQASTTR